MNRLDPRPNVEAPRDDGETLLERPRNETEKFRLTLKTYEGRPFIDARIYFRGTDGGWHPTKKGVSIRVGELAAVVDALQGALERLDRREPH